MRNADTVSVLHIISRQRKKSVYQSACDLTCTCLKKLLIAKEA